MSNICSRCGSIIESTVGICWCSAKEVARLTAEVARLREAWARFEEVGGMWNSLYPTPRAIVIDRVAKVLWVLSEFLAPKEG